jgi:hypothetical protein
MAVTFSPYAGGIVSVENEVLVKWYNITPSILGRGHVTLDVRGPVWVRFRTHFEVDMKYSLSW